MTTPVKYIGKRDTYREGCYGSGITFAAGQTIAIEDDDLARKLLRHKDVYVLGQVDGADKAPKQAKPASNEDENPQQPLIDSVATMTKDALTSFAKTNYSVSLDARKSVADLRAQVTGLIDQFGIE